MCKKVFSVLLVEVLSIFILSVFPVYAAKDVLSVCKSNKVKIAAKEYTDILKCWKKYQNPQEDRQSDSNLYTCINEKENLFFQRWNKIEEKAIKKEVDCSITNSPYIISEYIKYSVENIVSGISSELNLENKHELKLRRKLLKASIKKGMTLLKGEVKTLRKNSSENNLKIKTKATEKFEKQWTKAMDKAEKYDFTYNGKSMNEISSSIDKLVERIVDNINLSIPETTKIFTQNIMNNLSSISPDNSVLTFSQTSPELENIKLNDIIVIGVTNETPYGAIRKVEAISMENGQVIIETTQAALDEAIVKGVGFINKTLTPDELSSYVSLKKGVSLEYVSSKSGSFYLDLDEVVIYDHDKDLDTEEDQIKLDGDISFTPEIDLDIEIKDSELKELYFKSEIRETLELEVFAAIETGDKIGDMPLEAKEEIARFSFQPVVIMIGYVPVVITPIITINVGYEAEASAGLKTTLIQELTITTTSVYEDGEWDTRSDFSNDFDFILPSLYGECKARGYIGPQLNILLYSIAGPYVELIGYLEIEAGASIDVTGMYKLIYELFGGIEAGVGVRVELFDRDIVDYYVPDVIGYKRLLKSGEITGNLITGTISGSVKDAVTQLPIQDVIITVYKGNLVISRGKTDSNGFYSFSSIFGSNYTVTFTKVGYLPASYNNIDVEADSTTYLETVLKIDETYSGVGNVSGTILNALNGLGVDGLTINIREGINNKTGDVVNTTATDNGGSYSFSNISSGNYTGEAAGAGYNTTYFSIICIGSMNTENQDATITPILSSGETRIILVWSAEPADLDSHLTGPMPDGTRFHMYYPLAETNYGSPWPEYVNLNLDDITSYGPETTTIVQQIDGVYRFSVHDFTNKDLSYSTALTDSNAQVYVYRDSRLAATFNIPANHDGTLWTVFELNGSAITPINTITYELDDSSVNIDPLHMIHLPLKNK